jgi:hypothetical protein
MKTSINIKTILQALSLIMILGLMLSALKTNAQSLEQTFEGFTENELQSFVKINKDLKPYQEETQSKMLSVIHENGLDVNRFQVLAQAQQAGKLIDVSRDKEEIIRFNQAGQIVMEMQQAVLLKIQEMVKSSNLSEEKFHQIYMAYNQSDAIRTKIDAMMREDG